MTIAQGIQASLVKSIVEFTGMSEARAAHEIRLAKMVTKALGLTLAEVLRHSNLVAKS